MSLAKNVAAFLILSDGIPMIYAGQEQHYSGGSDPYNREATWLSGYSTESELYKLVAASNAIRTHAIGQDEGYLTYMVGRPTFAQQLFFFQIRNNTSDGLIITSSRR
jgi:alpha-amylase